MRFGQEPFKEDLPSNFFKVCQEELDELYKKAPPEDKFDVAGQCYVEAYNNWKKAPEAAVALGRRVLDLLGKDPEWSPRMSELIDILERFTSKEFVEATLKEPEPRDKAEFPWKLVFGAAALFGLGWLLGRRKSRAGFSGLEIVRKVYRSETGREEWALLSRKTHRPLKWWGTQKPTQAMIDREERRVQFFKHQRR